MSQDPSVILKGHEYISLTTFRKSGLPVATPVCFVAIGDKIYVRTITQTGKIQRILANSQVEIAPCDRVGIILGSSFQANARLVSREEEAPLYQALLDKYGSSMRLDAQAGPSSRTYIELTVLKS